MTKYFVKRNFRGTYSSVGMLKGYMAWKRLGTPALTQQYKWTIFVGSCLLTIMLYFTLMQSGNLPLTISWWEKGWRNEGNKATAGPAKSRGVLGTWRRLSSQSVLLPTNRTNLSGFSAIGFNSKSDCLQSQRQANFFSFTWWRKRAHAIGLHLVRTVSPSLKHHFTNTIIENAALIFYFSGCLVF